MTRGPSEKEVFALRGIGVARTPFHEKLDAPRQAVVAKGVEGRIDLFAETGFEDALDDLEGWERIWIVFVFDRAEGFRPKVLPPRSDKKRGVFATRSPHRPNPIGLSCVELVRVEGLSIHVRDLDLLDGTPVLDVKPYVAYADAFPRARSGWLDDDEPREIDGETSPADAGSRFDVAWSELASAQRDWWKEHGADLGPPIDDILSTSPRPHAYRRIRARPDGGFVLAHKEHRVSFRVDGRRVLVESIASGYRPRELWDNPELALHRAFTTAFPGASR